MLGKEATQAMLSQFPARDVEEPATRADIAELRAELHREMREWSDRLTTRMITIGAAGLVAIGIMFQVFR
jgi:hypothetical protein